jgi:hypothetical protein
MINANFAGHHIHEFIVLEPLSPFFPVFVELSIEPIFFVFLFPLVLFILGNNSLTFQWLSRDCSLYIFKLKHHTCHMPVYNRKFNRFIPCNRACSKNINHGTGHGTRQTFGPEIDRSSSVRQQFYLSDWRHLGKTVVMAFSVCMTACLIVGSSASDSWILSQVWATSIPF